MYLCIFGHNTKKCCSYVYLICKKTIFLFEATRCQDIPAPPRSSGLVYKPDPQNPLPHSGDMI